MTLVDALAVLAVIEAAKLQIMFIRIFVCLFYRSRYYIYRTTANDLKGPVLLSGLQCTGKESSLNECDERKREPCTHAMDVFVDCSQGKDSYTSI